MRLACFASACRLAGCPPAPAVHAPAIAAAATGNDAPARPAPRTLAGGIAGTLSHPGRDLPPMRICVFAPAHATPYRVRTGNNQTRYRLDGIPPGRYLVVAFPQEADALPGGHTGCVRRPTGGLPHPRPAADRRRRRPRHPRHRPGGSPRRCPDRPQEPTP